jgi:RimJ/RimL family protein N-acetyltransferase
MRILFYRAREKLTTLLNKQRHLSNDYHDIIQTTHAPIRCGIVFQGDIMSTILLPERFPSLETKRLVLREITLTDKQAIYRNYSDQETTRFIMEPLTRLKQAEEIIQTFQNGYHEGKAVFWGVSLKSNPALIGTCSFEDIQSEDHRAEVAYDLGKIYWGKGYMSEAMQAILSYGFG